MPYRLFRPRRLESGHRYPLVVFLHGASGSGTDNEKQLQRANWFGGLVWTLPENQDRLSCFVVAPQTNVNWPCVIIEKGKRPQMCPGLGTGHSQFHEGKGHNYPGLAFESENSILFDLCLIIAELLTYP